MKINTEDDGVVEVEITVAQARGIDDEIPNSLSEAFDEAQAYAFEGKGNAYLVICIRG